VKLRIGISPCPNDTFMFHDLATGVLQPAGGEVEMHLHDVETLNRRALAGEFDVTKLSFHAWLLVRETYEMLSVGAALGYGCGPVVVSREPVDSDDLPRCRIAIPGELTTAHLLLRLRAPGATDKLFVPYDQVMALVAGGQADAGVIIHEGRFTYRQAGLRLVCDLGQWWQDTTSLPIPLGCIAARRSLGDETIRSVEALLRQSIVNALADPEHTYDYVRQHAQEMDGAVLSEHVRTFVNDYSLDLGDEGLRAVEKLDELARAAGILP